MQFIDLFWFLTCSIIVQFAGGVEHMKADSSWPKHKEFGQLSSVSVDKEERIFIFHRGDRKWDASTFDRNDKLVDTSAGPIPQETIVVLNKRGDIIGSTGQNMFYIPHGLTVDDDLNLWVTDVGLHQVFKYPPLNLSSDSLPEPIITIGTRFTPGKSTSALCKPTSVAVDSELKDFFVADGYCNSRIVKYDQKGRFLVEWGKKTLPFPFPKALGPYNLNVPHSLVIDERRKHIIVADRENFRISFYTLDGAFVQVYPMKSRVYGISYSATTDTLQAVTGPSPAMPGQGIIFSLSNDSITSMFGHFESAHDVAVSADARFIYVVETSPFIFSRFTVDVPELETSETEEPKVRRVNPIGSPPKVASVEEVNVSAGNIQEGGPGFEPDASTSGLGANQAALSLISLTVLLAIIAVTCHLRKRRGSVPMERRGLILEDDEDR